MVLGDVVVPMKEFVIIACTVAGLFAVSHYLTTQKQPKACPGEVVSMVIDKDGTILCTYMLVPQGVTKEVKKAK